MYGCHNQPRPLPGATLTGSAHYGSQQWTFASSTQCQYDGSESDLGCRGCKWQKGALLPIWPPAFNCRCVLVPKHNERKGG